MPEMCFACQPVDDVIGRLKTGGAADSSGAEGENITRASTPSPLSSQPTVVDVLNTHHVQWAPHLRNRRNHIHGAMSASFKRQCNTIYRQHHRLLCDCRRSNSPPPFLLPPCSTHLRHISLHSPPGHQTIYPVPETGTFSCTTHVGSLSSCSIDAEFSSAIRTQIDSTTTEQQEYTSMDNSCVQLMSTTWNADVSRYPESYIGWVAIIEAPTHPRTTLTNPTSSTESMLRSSCNGASVLVTSTMYFSVNFLCTLVGAVLHVPVMPIMW